EDFLATTQGRGQINDVEAAVARDGTVLALRARTVADLGAYLEILTPYAGMLTGRLLTGPYRIPAARYELTSVFTNAMATAPYRGAGRPEATYLLERTMDAIARSCGLDPAEVRRRNLIRPEEFPYRAPSGLVYDSGQYEAALDRALAMGDYKRLRDLQRPPRARRRAPPRDRLLDLHGDRGRRPVQDHTHPRLGKRHRAGRDVGQDHRAHGHEPAWPGARNGLCPDRRRPPGGCDGRCRGPPRRYRHRRRGRRDVRQPFHRRRRACPRRVGGQGARQGAADRGRAPRGRR